MRSHLTLGRLFGVPIGVNGWVFVIAIVLAWSLASVSLPSIAPAHPDSAYWFAGIVGVVAFLGSLVLHELGHSWVAQRNDVEVAEITLWLFGGVAKLEGDADNPGAEFRIALAGPAMSALTALVAGVLAWGVRQVDGSEVMFGLLVWLSGINAVLAVSNLLPAFPLDGGRILRAVLWRRMQRKIRATRVAALWGQILAGAMGAVGLWLTIRVSVWSGLWILALSLFLFVAARSEWAASAPAPTLLEMPVSRVRRPLPVPLGPTATVADAEAALARDSQAPLVPLTDRRATVSAMVTRDAIGRIPPAQRSAVPATSVAESLVTLPRVSPGESVSTVLGRLGDGRQWWALVVDGDGSMGALLSSDVDVLLEAARG
ncbi:MAG: site-2 protease family protein [Actinomycetia bacterium]|nr:site-2 protease family protein [Actinomycetes bacterium]